MKRNSIPLTIVILSAGLTIFTSVGCGGGGASTTSSTSQTATPAMPQPGNYQAKLDPSSNSQSSGSVVMSVDSSGNLTIAAGVTGKSGIYTGSTMIGANDAFTAVLTDSSNGQTATASGMTYSNNIAVSLTGSITSSSLKAVFKGTSNPFAASAQGSLTGGLTLQSQPMSLTISGNGTNNVSGTITSTSNGTLNVSGSLTSVGVFNATAPYGSAGGKINLSGTFMFAANGKVQGSGIWTDSLNVTNTGSWAVSAN